MGSKTLKRLISSVLSLSILCTQFVTMPVLAETNDTKSLTEAQVIINNYDAELTEQEKDVLKNSGIKSETLNYVEPTAADNLVTLDGTTVKVDEYTDAYGNVWTPVSATLKEDGKADAPITLANGEGTINPTSNNYSVEVDYKLVAQMSDETRANLLNAAHVLTIGVDSTDFLAVKGSENIDGLNTKVSLKGEEKTITGLLKMMVDGFEVYYPSWNYTATFKLGSNTAYDSSAAVAAIEALYAQEQNGGYDLSKCGAEYAAYVGNEVAYIGEGKAADLLAVAIESRDYLKAIYDNAMISGNELFDTITMMRNLGATTEASALTTIMNEIGAIIAVLDDGINNDWTVLGAVDNIVSDSVDSTLSAAVSAARGFTTLHVNDGRELVVAETTVVASMNRNDVKVTVNATVYDGASSSTVSKTYTYHMETGTSAADVETVIRNGIEAEAKADWSASYQVNETYYDRTVVLNSVGNELTADAEYVITYTPKNFAVTSVSAPALAKGYPYGYELVLPSGADFGLTYTYTVNGQSYPENTPIRVTGDMVIERTEDKAKDANRVLDLLANDTNYSLSAALKKVLTNKALKSATVSYKVPEAEDGLVTLSINGEGKYELVALTYHSGTGNMVWKPVAYYLGGQRIEFNGTAVIDDTTVKSIKVDYELSIEGVNVTDVLNSIEKLMNDTAYQVEQLNRVGSKKQLMAENGSNIYLALGMLIDNIKYNYENEDGAYYGQTMSDVDAAVIADLNFLRSNCFKSKNLIIANYIYDGDDASYNNLKSYYSNSGVIMQQLGYLVDKLDADVTKHPEFVALLASDPKFSAYGDQIDELVATLNEVYVKLAPPSEMVDTASDSVNDLYRSMVTGASLGAVTDKGLTAYTSITVQGKGQLATNVTVKVLNSKGEVIEKISSSELSFAAGATYTANDIKEIEDVIVALTEQLTTELKYYNAEEAEGMPSVGDTVAKGEVSVTYTAKTVTVTIEGEPDQAITIDNLTVKLPAHTNPEYRYEYTVNGNVVAAGEYDFTPAEFESLMNAGKLEITRAEINVGESYVIDLFNGLNAGMGNKDTEFVLVKNNNMRALSSKYVAVLRIATTELNQIQNVLMGVATGLTASPYNYIAMGTNDDAHAIWGNDKVSVQALIDGILESGVGFDTLINLIDNNGDIVENISPLLGHYSVVVGNAADMTTLGGAVVESALYLGDDSSSVTEIPFFISIQDYDTQASTLLSVKEALVAVRPYLDVNTNGGSLNVVVNAPDRLYQVMLAGLLATGYADLDDVSAIELEAIVEYLKKQLDIAVLDDTVSAQTYQNTLDKLNAGVSLSAYMGTIDTILNLVRTINNTAIVSNESYTNDTYSLDVAADIMPIISKLGYDSFASVLRETTLSVSVNSTLENLGTAYEAAIFDNSKSGLDKVYFTKDFAAVAPSLGNNAIVILLGNVGGDVVLNNGIILDLNGKTMPSLKANAGTTKIFNSAFEADGGVTGAISGNFNIAGGKYGSDVSSMVVEGYTQTNGVVESDLYRAYVDGNKLVVELEVDFIDPARETDLTYFAIDLALQMGLEFYTASKLNVEGSDIYAFESTDLIDDFFGDTNIVNTALHILNYPGLTTFTNTVIDDLTNWGALAAAVESGNPLVSYDLTTTPWGVSLTHIAAEDYMSVAVAGDASVAKDYTLEIRVRGNASDDDNVYLAKLLREFEKVLTVDADVALNDVSYSNEHGLTADYFGDGEIVIDFTQADNGEDYTTLMGLILAYANPSMKTPLQNYINKGDVAGLIDAFDELTVANVISAIKSIRGVSFAKLSAGYDAADVAYLESIYHVFLQGTAGVLNKLEVTGRSTKLGALAVANGVYEIEKSLGNISGKITLKLFAEKDPVVTAYAKVNADKILAWEIDYTNHVIKLDLAVTKSFNGLALDKFGDEFYLGFDVNGGVLVNTTFDQDTVDAGVLRNGTVVVVEYAKNASATPSQETWTIQIVGDVNCNGLIESNDAALIAKKFVNNSFTLNDTQTWAADVNGNGTLESNDALLNAYKWTLQTDKYTSKLRNVEEGK